MKMVGSLERSDATWSSTTSEGEVTNARAVMVWGAMGTHTSPVKSGVTIGPPAERA